MGIMIHLVETGPTGIDLHFNTDKIVYLEERRHEGTDTTYSVYFNAGGSSDTKWNISEKSFKELVSLMNHGAIRTVTIEEEVDSTIL
jgi:hypothetical protein